LGTPHPFYACASLVASKYGRGKIFRALTKPAQRAGLERQPRNHRRAIAMLKKPMTHDVLLNLPGSAILIVCRAE